MRCFVEPENWNAAEVELAGEEAHHLRTVLRGRVGQPVGLFDGQGRTAEAEVIALERHTARGFDSDKVALFQQIHKL